MSIRETINKRPGLAAGGAAAVIVAALAFMFLGGDPSLAKASKAYYTDDDGKTYFADSIDKLFPFDHNGKPAYRAFVYRCNGKEFVAYVARYSDATKAQISGLLDKQSDPDVVAKINQLRGGTEVKRPGDSRWVPAQSQEGWAVTGVHCPDGGTLEGVSP